MIGREAYTCLSCCSEIYVMETEVVYTSEFRNGTTDGVTEGSVGLLGVMAHFGTRT